LLVEAGEPVPQAAAPFEIQTQAKPGTMERQEKETGWLEALLEMRHLRFVQTAVRPTELACSATARLMEEATEAVPLHL
jgi:hypothetical protein